MSLATVIRLEFAYPGVGILAGDSLQYLSVATAHGVIMVFYMIMPAIFGAFGNFLLPTQLGVHDVAFPRLNSAAFWFLPGGLIMLFQLVCTDRRYARMNCFNIRELQGILKRKFFTDLIDSHDYRDLLKGSMISLRYKLNSNVNLDFDTFSFYKFGTHNYNTNKSVTFNKRLSVKALSSYDYFFLTFFKNTNLLGSYFSSFLYNIWFLYTNTIVFILTLPSNFKPSNLFNFLNVFNFLSKTLLINISNFSVFNSNLFTFNFSLGGSFEPKTLTYNVSDNKSTIDSTVVKSFTEHSSNQRFTRFNNILINYDYKTGNYIGN